MQVGDRRFALTLASDVVGDATSLELHDVTAGQPEAVGEVRYADASGALTVSLYRRDVPLAAVEHLLAEARRRLLPAVAVVVDPAFGDGLAALAARVPVWVADTPDNRAAAGRVWGGAAGGLHEVTTFRVDPAAAPAAWCAGVLPAIMDHHGGGGPHPRAGLVEVVSAAPGPELAGALAAADIDAVLARAEAAGGRVLYPKTSIGALGWVAEFEDSEGNCIALHAPAAAA